MAWKKIFDIVVLEHYIEGPKNKRKYCDGSEKTMKSMDPLSTMISYNLANRLYTKKVDIVSPAFSNLYNESGTIQQLTASIISVNTEENKLWHLRKLIGESEDPRSKVEIISCNTPPGNAIFTQSLAHMNPRNLEYPSPIFNGGRNYNVLSGMDKDELKEHLEDLENSIEGESNMRDVLFFAKLLR